MAELIELAVEPPYVPSLNAQCAPKIDASANSGYFLLMKLVAPIKPAPPPPPSPEGIEALASALVETTPQVCHSLASKKEGARRAHVALRRRCL